jgi:hypothetical protein
MEDLHPILTSILSVEENIMILKPKCSKKGRRPSKISNYSKKEL